MSNRDWARSYASALPDASRHRWRPASENTRNDGQDNEQDKSKSEETAPFALPVALISNPFASLIMRFKMLLCLTLWATLYTRRQASSPAPQTVRGKPLLRLSIEVNPGRYQYADAQFKIRLVNVSDHPVLVVREFDPEFAMALITTDQFGKEFVLLKRVVMSPTIFPRNFSSLSSRCGIAISLPWSQFFRDVSKPTDMSLMAVYGGFDPREAPPDINPSLLSLVWSNTVKVRLRHQSVEFLPAPKKYRHPADESG